MALTTTEEAQTRALIEQNAALLSLAASEPTIISKLAATKASLSDLPAATVKNNTDLFLVRQGTEDKSITGALAGGDAAYVSYTPTGVGTVATTVQGKLRESVSVLDFGENTVPGTTDMTAAIQAAIVSAIARKVALYIPSGNYLWTASNHFIDCFSTGLVIVGDGQNNSRITIDANGIAFDVQSYFNNQLVVLGVGFEVLNPTTNNNATIFRVWRRSPYGSFGASFVFRDCEFKGHTNCAIHGIAATQCQVTNNVISGVSPYTASSGLLATYDDAGIRLWGADGTTALQEHQFSNLINISDNWITGSKFGVDCWSATETLVANNNISNCYIGLSAKVNSALSPSSSATANASKGTTFGAVTIDRNWFEANALYHYSDADVDGAGVNIANTQADIYTNGGSRGTTPNTKIKSTCTTVVATNSVAARQYFAGAALSDKLFYSASIFDAASGNGLKYRLATREAFFGVPLRVPGVSFGPDAYTLAADPTLTLDAYKEGTFTPVLGTDGTQPTVAYSAQSGTYTRIGNVVHFNIYLVTSSYSGGTGNLTLSGFPYTISESDSVAAVSNKSVWTTQGPTYGRAVSATNKFYLYYDTATASTAVPGANMGGGSGTNLRLSGRYFTSDAFP